MNKAVLFCTQCSAPTQIKIPDNGDNKERTVCTICGHIQYENPLMIVGTIPVKGDKILLCRRNIEPCKGAWTLPAGFMEIGETLSGAAERETMEESGAVVELQGLFSIFNSCPFGFVHFYFRATILEASNFQFGHETQEIGFFDEAEIPWDEMAFSSVKSTLLHYYSDRKKGVFTLHELRLEDALMG